MDWIKVAASAYAAYSRSTDNKNFMGKEMPAWSDLPESIQIAWVAAAKQVAMDVASKIIEAAK